MSKITYTCEPIRGFTVGALRVERDDPPFEALPSMADRLEAQGFVRVINRPETPIATMETATAPPAATETASKRPAKKATKKATRKRIRRAME